MKIDVHLLCFNEADILSWTLAHYSQFASRIVLHDGYSTDDSTAIALDFGAEVKTFGQPGVLCDAAARDLKNNCWKGTDADWCIVADADELFYAPNGMLDTLADYRLSGTVVPKPHGFEMCSDILPEYHPGKQIYDLVKYAGSGDRWYSKPCLFSPKHIAAMNFVAGAHSCMAITHAGLTIGNPTQFSDPQLYLLHCKHLGPVERIAARYQRNQERHSEQNKANRWGNYEDPLKHARDKRAEILSTLRKIIP